jgi:pentatricopeptide repeat protein
MVNALRKRYKKGEIVTLYTSEFSFTGKIEDFENTCIILETDDNIEFVANNSILRFSVSKSTIINANTIVKTTNSIDPISIIEEQSAVVPEEQPTAVPEEQSTAIPEEQSEIVVDKQFMAGNGEEDEIKPLTEYKVGEKIPPELLETVTKKVPKFKIKPTSIYKSFDELGQLIEEEDKRIVNANGFISRYFPYRMYGFITNKLGHSIYFTFKNVIDVDLLEQLKQPSSYNSNIPVLFTLSKEYKNAALLIQRPTIVENIFNVIKNLIDEQRITAAIGLTEQILDAYPDNKNANKIKEQLISINQSKIEYYDSNYHKAVTAKLVDKDLETALKYYLIAFENNEKRESCIKDIGMLHVQMGKMQEALDFINIYGKELPNNVRTYNYFINFYSSLKEFEKVVEYIDLLVSKESIADDKVKRSTYLHQKGAALIQMNKTNEARETLNEAIRIYPENIFATRLLQALDMKKVADSFISGDKAFTNEQFNNFEEYSIQNMSQIGDYWTLWKEAERSIRDLIKAWIIEVFGENWEDEYLTKNAKDKSKMEGIKKLKETRTNINKKFDNSSSHLVDYTFPRDMYDLFISTDWKWFKKIFGYSKKDWSTKFSVLADIRNPVAHNNAEFISDDDLNMAKMYCSLIIKKINHWKNSKK